MEITLRNPRPGDIGWLISMHGMLYAEQFGFDADFEKDVARKVVAFLDKQHAFNRLWIAEVSDEPVGSIAVSLRPEQNAFINFLLVRPEYRGGGVAKTLMTKVVSHCLEHDIGLLALETYSCLASARNLYRQCGFTMSSKNDEVKKYGQSFDQEFWEKDLGTQVRPHAAADSLK